MTYEFTTHEIVEQQVLSIRDRVEPDAFPAFLGGAFPELFTHVGRHGAVPTGHPFVIYHAFGPELIDAEVCVPIAGRAPIDGRITMHSLPATTVIRTLHVGPYEELGSAYAALSEWVADHGLVATEPVRERYLVGVGDDVPPETYRTELDQPVAPLEATPEDSGTAARPTVGVG
jgi:effector-binding domain-containing protein